MSKAPYDPRAVANLLLDIADREPDGPVPISNVALQKLLYFAHGHFLIATGAPLVNGAFEAWRYGPVQPAVYHAFKSEADRPISTRASGRNVMTGEEIPLALPVDKLVRWHLRNVISGYGHLEPGHLIRISHARGGPWDTIVNQARTSVALGMRISDNVTKERFKHLKIAVATTAWVDVTDEDSPLAGN